MVTGVIRHPKGRLYEAAGLTGSRVYVSYATLDKYGQSNGINHYEILMPNPVENFALEKVKSGLNQSEGEVEYVENNTRFSLVNILKLIKATGTRSMNGKAIVYPFWENVARGHEDMTAKFVFLMLLCLVYPVGLVIFGSIWCWKHRKWTWKVLFASLRDKVAGVLEQTRESIRRHRQKKKDEEDLDKEENVYEKEMDE